MNKLINTATALTTLYTEAITLLIDMHLNSDSAKSAFVEGYVDRAAGIFKGEPEDFSDFINSPESEEGHLSLDTLEEEAERIARAEEIDDSDSGEPRRPRSPVRMQPLSIQDSPQKGLLN